MIIEINNKTRQRVNVKLLEKSAGVFGKKFRLNNINVSVAIVGDKRIRVLNQEYRNKNKVTDVLSFAGDQSLNLLGEIVICYQQIKRQAKKQKTTVDKELAFIFTHGLLHLVGYDDKTIKGSLEMEKLGIDLCKKL